LKLHKIPSVSWVLRDKKGISKNVNVDFTMDYVSLCIQWYCQQTN